MTGWLVVAAFAAAAVIVGMVAWAWRDDPAPDLLTDDELADEWARIGAQIRAERLALADDIADSKGEVTGDE